MTDFRPIDPEADDDWDAFVRDSPDGWVWGLAGWQRLIERVPEWRLQNLSFEMTENGRRVALMPLHLTAAGAAASSGWGWVGPILAPSLDRVKRRQVLRKILAHAEEVARTAGATTLQLGSVAVTRTNLTNFRGVNPFFEHGFEDRSANSIVVDLTTSEDQIWSNFSANARQEIRKAERLGCRAEQVNWAEHVDRYYEVHVETYRRTGVPPHPATYFSGIAEEIAPRSHAFLWAGFEPDGDVIAYHNNAVLGPGCLYHTGCSTKPALDTGINYLLMWSAIRGAKARDETHFEVGEVYPSAQGGKQLGLTRFKWKFGGELFRSYRAQSELVAEAPKSGMDTSTENEAGTLPPERTSSGVAPAIEWLRRRARRVGLG